MVSDVEIHTARSFYDETEDIPEIDQVISSQRSSRRTPRGEISGHHVTRYARNKRALLGRRASDRQFEAVREQASRMM